MVQKIHWTKKKKKEHFRTKNLNAKTYNFLFPAGHFQWINLLNVNSNSVPTIVWKSEKIKEILIKQSFFRCSFHQADIAGPAAQFVVKALHYPNADWTIGASYERRPFFLFSSVICWIVGELSHPTTVRFRVVFFLSLSLRTSSSLHR